MFPTLGFHAWQNTAITAFAPIIWGTTYIVSSELLPPDLPFTAALIRVLPAGVLLLFWVRVMPKRAQWLRLLLLALFNIAAFQALLFVAAYRLPGGIAAILGAIQPMLVMGMAWFWERRQPSCLAVLFSVTGLSGMMFLLLSPESRWDSVGIAAALVGAASMATGTYFSRRWTIGLPVLASTGWQLCLGGIMLLPAALLFDPPLPNLSTTAMLGYAYLSIFGALISYGLWFRGLAYLPNVAVSALGLLSPVTAVMLGWVLLGQEMRGLSLLGLILVLVSVVGVQRAMHGRNAAAYSPNKP